MTNFSGANREKVESNILILVKEFGSGTVKKEPEVVQTYVGPPDLGFREFQHDNMVIQKYESVDNIDKMAEKVKEIITAA